MQTTVKKSIRFTGTGVHSGLPARLTIHPAAANHGIWFRRTDLPGNTMIHLCGSNILSEGGFGM